MHCNEMNGPAEAGGTEFTHLAFSDESQHNTGRYRSIATVSIPASFYPAANSHLAAVLSKCGIRELKWEKLRTARERFAALAFVNWAVSSAAASMLQLDVLLWDVEDRRHKIKGRDDNSNLQRMYYHLFKHVLHKWPREKSWGVYPDEQSSINWKQLYGFTHRYGVRDILTGRRIGFSRGYAIEELLPRDSAEESLVQLADVFAGMAVFTRTSYAEYINWLPCAFEQMWLFPGERPKVSGSHQERWNVVTAFLRLCNAHGLNVHFHESKGLRSLSKFEPINFWWYEPQHKDDKAPVRARRRRSTKREAS